MAGPFHHEQLYRGGDQLRLISQLQITLCGAGALGSNLADNLARQGFGQLRVIDHDRVEEHNISTQIYGQADIGVWKTEALRNRLFRTSGIEIDALRKELTAQTARSLLKAGGLIVDTFDNSRSRELVQQFARSEAAACLHVGLYADYGEIVWDEHYRVPRDVAGDVCDYPLARNLVLLSVAVAAETIVRFATTGQRQSWTVTLNDFAIRPYEVS